MAILAEIIETLTSDAAVRELRAGPYWVAVWSRYCGLASTLADPTRIDVEKLELASARSLAQMAVSPVWKEAGIGIAAINSLLEVDETRCRDLNARDLLMERGAGKRVALVGHFPFVPQLRDAVGELSVLELQPRPGDLPASEAPRVVPEADVVAITGTALVNGTMEDLLGYCRPQSLVVLLGPTVPLSPVLFDYGVDVICGTRVIDPPAILAQVEAGRSYREMTGVRMLAMQRDAQAG
ncbi:MAG: DUF364 domain-containing protein [Dehalococcoidia bacterium]|nr:DUF364 domain-containing protein [Dehalococcoidia bacterium]